MIFLRGCRWVASFIGPDFILAKILMLCYNEVAMKNRKHYYISVKNPLTWLMVLCMIGSAVTRLVFGLEGAELWSQIVLPITAALLYALVVLMNGKLRLFKSALPFWLMAIYFCFRFDSYHYGNYHLMISVLYGVACITTAIAYTQITAGKSRPMWLPGFVLFPALAVLYLERQDPIAALPDGLMMLGVLWVVFGMKRSPADRYYPTWGDRVDGRRIRSISPISQIIPYFMVHRNESSNLIHMPLEITPAERYMRQKRKEGYTNFVMTHVLLAAYCRAIAAYPAANRFLSGQKVYSRGEDIEFLMTVKKDMTTDAPDTVINLHLSPWDTADEVYNKLQKAIDEVKNTPLDSSMDKTAGAFSLIPGVVLKFAIWLLKLLDYFGLLPKFLLEVSPFHGSVVFTNLGSLGIPPVYHHLYDFGNIPIFLAFGAKRRENQVLEDGTVVQRKYLDLNITTDERTCDGFYYAAFVKHFVRLLRHPEQFDVPPETVVQDVD